MDKLIVYDKELSKADALVLKTLAADIKDVSAKKPLPNGIDGNGDTKTANGSTTPSPPSFAYSFIDLFAKRHSQARPNPQTASSARTRPSATRLPCRP